MNTHTNSPLLDEYKSEMEVTVAALSLVSAISSLAVVITTLYIIYRERRDGIDNTVSSGARLLNLCFVFSTFVLSIFFIMHPFFSLLGYSLEQHRRMCIIQATGILYSASCMVWFWFFITLRLCLILYFNNNSKFIDQRGWLYVLAALGLSAIGSFAPVAGNAVEFEYVWCFVGSDRAVWLYTSFYGVLGIVCVVGLFLWGYTVVKICRPLWYILKARRKRGSYWNLTRHLPQDTGNSEVPQQQQQRGASPRKAEPGHFEKKAMLFLFRQVTFVLVFEIMFIITFSNHLYITINNEQTLWGWMMHIIIMGIYGFTAFLVFGLTSQNISVWKHCARRIKRRMMCCCGNNIDESSYEDTFIEEQHEEAKNYRDGVWWQAPGDSLVRQDDDSTQEKDRSAEAEPLRKYL